MQYENLREPLAAQRSPTLARESHHQMVTYPKKRK